MKIFKYILKEMRAQKVVVPQRARILSVVNQYEKIVLYVIVDVNEPSTKSLEIFIYGTGHEIKIDTDKLRFLGTVKLDEGDFMWHVFMKNEGGLDGVE